jgi:hypothetical protein
VLLRRRDKRAKFISRLSKYALSARLYLESKGDLLMCPLCATSAALTAAAATTTATAIGTLGFDATRLFIARWVALLEWFRRHLESGERNSTGVQDER